MTVAEYLSIHEYKELLELKLLTAYQQKGETAFFYVLILGRIFKQSCVLWNTVLKVENKTWLEKVDDNPVLFQLQL